MEGDFIKIRKWLTPLSMLYGMVVGIRNQLFELGVLKSRSFDIPVISVGNITVGGSGKTPHIEYLVRLLKDKVKVAVLSRGYKRKSKGYVLADADTSMSDIGDEPYQMKKKFPDIYIAVDKNRCEGIDNLTQQDATKDTDVVLLDDAFQHRYVKPGVNILLVDYHRLIISDKLLPAGRLREPKEGKARADIVIITKCPKDLKAINYRMLTRSMNLFPYQSLFFTTLEYGELFMLFGNEKKELDKISDQHVLLLTGIASPQQMILDLEPLCLETIPLAYSDHHDFKAKDIARINQMFEAMPAPKMIITTEKDAARLETAEGLNDEVRNHLYVLPVEIKFMQEQEELFNHKILSYVQKNSRNSILVKNKDEHKSEDSHHSGNGSRTISFRNY
jgi:tetraacyldisaccharide 4'-kinase